MLASLPILPQSRLLPPPLRPRADALRERGQKLAIALCGKEPALGTETSAEVLEFKTALNAFVSDGEAMVAGAKAEAERMLKIAPGRHDPQARLFAAQDHEATLAGLKAAVKTWGVSVDDWVERAAGIAK